MCVPQQMDSLSFDGFLRCARQRRLMRMGGFSDTQGRTFSCASGASFVRTKRCSHAHRWCSSKGLPREEFHVIFICNARIGHV